MEQKRISSENVDNISYSYPEEPQREKDIAAREYGLKSTGHVTGELLELAELTKQMSERLWWLKTVNRLKHPQY